MFKYWSIKKYGEKLLPTLQKRYGVKETYSAHEIRATVYQKDFNPKYLPLGYLLFMSKDDIPLVMFSEFPDLCISSYKKGILNYLAKKQYQGVIPTQLVA